MRTIYRKVVGAFIFSNDNHLLLGKSREGGVYKGAWLVPGGGIEKGETKLEAVQREVLEEVGIDISNFDVKLLDTVLTGESNKVLRSTNEQVLVKMTFYNFLVHVGQPADELVIKCDDDFVDAKWHLVTDLNKLTLSSPSRVVLTKLGIL
ncbi:NUDIX hydrolase [Candidatus Saccharibacteria bacterium CPR2]|nr:NUDIX hydrolase [Candidatus Saccharibacteria bacterium CPR2]